MREIARKWIIQVKLGLLNNEDLIKLVDSYIMNNDNYPDWMLKISMSESIDREPRLDLVLDPITENECSFVATKILEHYNSGKLDMYSLTSIAKKMISSLDNGCREFDYFMWICDEVDLINQGYKLNNNFDANIRQVLNDIITL